jgi:exosortase family protein XrtM
MATQATWSSTRFAVLMVLLYAALHAAYFAVPDDTLRNGFHHVLVSVSAAVINAVQPAAAVRAEGNLLSSGRAALEIVRGCDGSGVVFILTAAVLAFPAGWRAKLLGIAAGAAVVLLLNQLRIIGLYFVAAYREPWFLPLHAYLIPTLLVVAAAAFFLWWSQWASGPRHD